MSKGVTYAKDRNPTMLPTELPAPSVYPHAIGPTSVVTVTGFPKDKDGYDSVLVIVCRLSKMVKFLPARSTDKIEDTAHNFLWHIYTLFGLPDNITSDQDPKFTSNFWKAVNNLLRERSPIVQDSKIL